MASPRNSRGSRKGKKGQPHCFQHSAAAKSTWQLPEDPAGWARGVAGWAGEQKNPASPALASGRPVPAPATPTSRPKAALHGTHSFPSSPGWSSGVRGWLGLGAEQEGPKSPLQPGPAPPFVRRSQNLESKLAEGDLHGLQQQHVCDSRLLGHPRGELGVFLMGGRRIGCFRQTVLRHGSSSGDAGNFCLSHTGGLYFGICVCVH